jgi:RNA polymerase sigma-70 factor (ECF subfamily)
MCAVPVQANFPDLSDAELAQHIQRGSGVAFETMMRRHNQLLYRTARSILRDDTEAEDVLQDAYLLAYQNIGQYRGDARLSTWLTRIVVNEAIARSRRQGRRAEVLQLHGEMEQLDEVAMDQEHANAPERDAMRTQTRALLEKLIDSLPEAFRVVFVMRGLQELSGEEVAACLDISEATVRTRFFRARSLLREALSQQIDFAHEEAFGFDGARCDRIVANAMSRFLSVSSGQPDPS